MRAKFQEFAALIFWTRCQYQETIYDENGHEDSMRCELGVASRVEKG